MRKSTKILCLLLALFMLQMVGLALPAGAEEEQAPIVIKDPGFEETDQGWLKNWVAKETEGASFGVSTEKAHSGKSSVYIKAISDTYSWVAQGSVHGLEPGSMYSISAFVNVDMKSGDGAQTMIEYYTDSGQYINQIAGGSMDSYPNGSRIAYTNGLWQEHITIFKVPEGAAVAKVYMLLKGIGTAYFDDVSITFSGGPAPFRFDTKNVFNYKEQETGGAYVKLDPYYLGSDTEKAKVDYALMDGETVVTEEKDVKFRDLEATFSYPIEGLEAYKPYTVSCKIRDKDGAVLEEHSREVYVVDKPTILDEDGDFFVDGKKLNPVIGWSVPAGDYARAKEAGMNTVYVGGSAQGNSNAAIQAVVESGLYAIVTLDHYPHSAGHPDYIEDAKRIVEIWRDVPNVIGYGIQDEPWLIGDNLEHREHNTAAYLMVRELDPHRSVVLVDKRNDHITTQYCDTYILDSYAFHMTDNVSKEAKNAYEYSKDKNSFWELAATYYISSGMPTANSVRNSIYRAFEEGARGAGYYTFSEAMKGRPGYEYSPQLYNWEDWEPFCTFNNVEVPILFDYFVNGNAVPFNEFDDGNDIYSLKWFNWFIGDDMYLVAHNRGREVQTVKIPLKSANGKVSIGGFKAEPIGLTKEGEIKGKNNIELTLGVEEIALYKITPDQKVDLAKVMEPADEAPEVPAEDGIFSDLAGYDWAKEAIESLYEDGIVNAKEEGIYAPGEAITRLDFVSALVRALELTEEGEAFPDCDAPEIKIARAAGITNGDTDGNLRPYDTITRQDIMTTAVRALNAGLSEAEIPKFSDWSLVSDYALEAVQVMTQAGVIQGNGDGTLNPLGNATRAEAAVMLERMLGTEFTEKPNPDEIREEIEFTSKVEETTLQNWSDAADLINGLGIAGPELEKSVTKGDFEAAVSNLLGTNYDAFAENNKAITYEEAVEALVKLLGYEAHAASRGGYMAMAAQLDLIKGLAPETYIRGGELCVLLENAIEIKMAERTGYGESESYTESEDTLLSAYRNIYKYKGTVEGDYYTNTSLKKGEILLNGEVFEGGEGFFKQRVVAYAEHTNDAKKIHYIKPANDTEVITVDREDILEADISKIRVDGKGGKDKIYSISGAGVYINGEKKFEPTSADLRPDMGTVSIISSGGTVTAVLVEKYENRIVESVYADENTVYFKNGDDKDLVLDTEKDRFYMDFDLKSLKEWDVLSVMYRDEVNEKVYKVIVSSENVQGAPSETSTDGILLGETIYPVAQACFGTPVLGTDAVFYLDFQGKIAAVNDAGVTPEYGYLTAVAGGKGLSGGVSLRIFTKNNEMKVFRAADNIKLNGEPVTEDELIKEELAIDEDTGKQTGQLIVYELNEEEKITEIRTANKDAVGKTNYVIQKQFSPGSFILVNDNLDSDGGTYTSTHGFQMLGTLYRITTDTVTFNVPPVYSDNANDYKATMGGKAYTHGTNVGNIGSLVYDWHDDYTVGAVVRPGQVLSEVSNDNGSGVFLGFGEALDEDGMPVKMIRMLLPAEGIELQYYVDPDLKVDLGRSGIALSDVTNPNETEKTGNTLNADIPLSALNFGDVVQFAANGSEIAAMRVLLRAESPKKGEYSSRVQKPKRLYGPLVIAYGDVQMVFNDGFSMTAVKDERMFLEIHSGGKCPVIIMDLENEKYKVLNMSGLREGDKVFVSRYNAYQTAIVAYR